MTIWPSRATTRMPEPERGFAEVNGALLYYEKVGAGPAVVFIHDIGEDRRVWDAQMALFAPRYTVVRYDMRGWGRSPLTPGVYRHAEDLATLLRTLHIEQAAVVGFRKGANVAVEYALDHPENVNALVLVQPFMSWFIPTSGQLIVTTDPDGKRLLEEISRAFQQKSKLKRMSRLMLALLRAPAALRRARHRAIALTDPGEIDTISVMRRALYISLTNIPKTFRSLFTWPWKSRGRFSIVRPDYKRYMPKSLNPPAIARLTEIQAPALVILQQPSSPIMEEMARVVAHDLPRGRLETLQGRTSYPHMESPVAFYHLVERFLGETAPEENP